MSLDGFIFTCNADTVNECLERKVFGLPAGRQPEVSRIAPCTPLFLFNYTTKELICGFEADGYGKKHLCPAAFNGRFPAQVKVKILQPGLPRLNSDQYGPVVFDNARLRRLRHSLTKQQVTALLQLAASAPRTPTAEVLRQERMRYGREVGRKWYGNHSVPTNNAPVAKRSRLLVPRPRPRDSLARDLEVVEPLADRLPAPTGGTVLHPAMVEVNNDTMMPDVVDLRGKVEEPKGTVEPNPGIDGEPSGGLTPLGNGQERQEETPKQLTHPAVTTTTTPAADVSFGDEITEEWIDSRTPQQKPQTTVVVHPVPSGRECSVHAVVNALDLVCKGRYRFLLVEATESAGRAIFVDFMSEADVAKLQQEWGGKRWNRLLGGRPSEGIDEVKLYSWKECQGLDGLTKAFGELHYLHVGEPSACPCLIDDYPLFFLSNTGSSGMPDQHGNERESRETKEMQRSMQRECQSTPKGYDYQELHDRIKKDCGDEADAVAAKFKEAVVASVRTDLADAKVRVTKKFDVEEFREHPEYELFKVARDCAVEELGSGLVESNPKDLKEGKKPVEVGDDLGGDSGANEPNTVAQNDGQAEELDPDDGVISELDIEAQEGDKVADEELDLDPDEDNMSELDIMG